MSLPGEEGMEVFTSAVPLDHPKIQILHGRAEERFQPALEGRSRSREWLGGPPERRTRNARVRERRAHVSLEPTPKRTQTTRKG